MIDRTNLSTLTDKRLRLRASTDAESDAGYVNSGDIVLTYRNKIVASINVDDLFDQFGNRFNIDIDL